MALFALVSPGGSPGVTTAALALALGWPGQLIIAECDPSGGDIMAGLLAGHLPAGAGLLSLALEAGHGTDTPAAALWRHLVELDDERSRLLLAGLSDPRQAAGLAGLWPALAATLAGMPADVIADCGRVDLAADVRPVLVAASLAVMVLRPTLRQISRAVPRIEMLTGLLGRQRLVAMLVGEGTCSARDVARAIGIPVAATLPHDAKTAAVLSDGSGNRRGLSARPLARAAIAAGRPLREAAQAAAAAGPAGQLAGAADAEFRS
jgi:hypothetical protein